ncbi:MAG: hypothetical protein L6Q69_21430 [Zoogloea sp.]|nr:hypothetical protein [Zoogloea sp.]
MPLFLCLIALVAALGWSTASAIEFVDQKPAPSWRNIQTPSSMACEMSTAGGRQLYVGQCQNALPHGRGLLITHAKGIEGAKMDKGTAYQLSKPELLQDTQQYAARAVYLYGFHRINWTEDRFNRMPAPMDSAQIPVAQQFISIHAASDTDGLVEQARQAIRQATARAHVRAWRYVEAAASSAEVASYIRDWNGQPDAGDMGPAEAIRRQRFRAEYDQAFRHIGDIRSAHAFIDTYAGNDPDGRLPDARAKLVAFEAEARRVAEMKARERAAFEAREAANPVCVAQRKTCVAQCQVWGDSARWRCEAACERIRCD